jgi:hypothetical protein
VARAPPAENRGAAWTGRKLHKGQTPGFSVARGLDRHRKNQHLTAFVDICRKHYAEQPDQAASSLSGAFLSNIAPAGVAGKDIGLAVNDWEGPAMQ